MFCVFTGHQVVLDKTKLSGPMYSTPFTEPLSHVVASTSGLANHKPAFIPMMPLF